MKTFKTYLLALAAVLFSAVGYTQISVTTESDATVLAQTLIGSESGVTIVSASYTGYYLASGIFSDGEFGIEEGILLTTGRATTAIGPNTIEGAGASNGMPGDPDLTALVAPFTTYDATILEITFIPDGNSLEFTYVFGSEEYNEYVCSIYNDVFAFFVSGGDYSNENIALIPGTDPPMPVAINNVNNGTVGVSGSGSNCTDEQMSNTAFYIDNADGENIQYDGYTVPLSAVIAVEPGVEYTIRLAIADAGDSILDSGVFLQGESFVSVICDVGELVYNGPSEFCQGTNLNFSNTGDGFNDQYRYIVTDENGFIVKHQASGSFNTAGWDPGAYFVYGMSYSGNLIGFGGDAPHIENVSTDGCYEIAGPIEVFVLDCEEPVDCPNLEANIGDVCVDADGNLGVVNANCQCEVEDEPTGDCENFLYFLADNESDDAPADIFKVTLSGGDAVMEYIATSEVEVHIAYNPIDHLIYAVTKYYNSYLTLDPNTGDWGPEVFFDEDLGEITTAVFSHHGKLLLGSQTHKKLYGVNLITEEITVYDDFAPVSGGDLAYRSDGMLYLASRTANGLYEVWPAPMADLMVGLLPPDVTGLAITNSDQLLVSANTQTSLILKNTDGSDAGSFNLFFEGEPYTLRSGDLASGCGPNVPIDGPCEDFTTFVVNHGPSIDGSDIYTVNFSGSDAHLSLLTNVAYEAHIAFNAEDQILYIVNVDGSSIDFYDLSTFAFIGNLPILDSFSKLTSVVYNPADGFLYVGSQITKEVHKIDLADGSSIYFGDAPVHGGDLEVSEDGSVYLATRDNAGELYKLVEGGSAVLVGSIPSLVTGMAAFNDSDNSFVTSNKGSSVFYRVSSVDGSVIAEYDIKLGGESFTLTDGDMAAGCKPNDPIIECDDYTMFLVNHDPNNIDGSDIYAVLLSAGEAQLTFIDKVDYEAHIAYNADEKLLYIVNVDGSSFEVYDPVLKSVVETVPIIGSFSKLTAVVFNAGDGYLYVGDHHADEVHKLDPATGVSSYFADAEVSGGDLGIMDDGNLYLASRHNGGEFYLINEGGSATFLGSIPQNVTGITRFDEVGDNFIISNRGASVLTRIDLDGNTVETFDVKLGTELFVLSDGDMAGGCGSIDLDIPEPGDCHATEVVEFIQGTKSNGGAIGADRSDASQALGAPERTDQLVFVSLGYGGSLTLAFDGSIPNGPGADIEIVETSFSTSTCAQYPEYADVYVSVDGANWYFAKTVCKFDGFVDISDAGNFDYVNFVKIVNNNTDTTTPDGFDVDGVVALHNCEITPAKPLESVTTLSAYPNPTEGSSKVVFKTPQDTRALLEVYDMSGRKVATLFNQDAQRDVVYTLDFNGNNLPNGIYVYRLTTQNGTTIEKFVITR